MNLTETSKTINFEFILSETSKKTVEDLNLEVKDIIRNDNMEDVQNIANNYYRRIIERIFENDVRIKVQNGIIPIESLINESLSLYKKDVNKEDVKSYKEQCMKRINALEKECLEKIQSSFKEYNTDKVKPIFDNIFLDYPKYKEIYTAGSLGEYFNARKLVFGIKKNSIAYRIVCENVPVLVKNINHYKFISNSEKYKNFIIDKSMFSKYNILNQDDINKYNNFISDLNYKLNEYCNKNNLSFIKFDYLKKQILSDSQSLYGIEVFNNINEIHTCITSHIDEFQKNVLEIKNTIQFIDENRNEVYISKKDIGKFVHKIDSNWNNDIDPKDYLNDYIKDNFKGKERAKKKSQIFYSLQELEDIFGTYEINRILKFDEAIITIDINNYLMKKDNQYLQKLCDDFLYLYKQFNLFVNDNIFTPVYASINKFIDMYKKFNTDYNKIRNFVTKSDISYDKFHITFNNEHWGEGITKDFLKKSFIFEDNGKYYIGNIIDSHVSKLNFSNHTSNEGINWFFKVNLSVKTIFHVLNTEKIANHFKNSDDDYEIKSDVLINPIKITKYQYENSKDDKIYKELCIKCLMNHKDFYKFDWIQYLGDINQYDKVSFNEKIEKETIKLFMCTIDREYIYNLEKERKIIIGEIYCKDFSNKSHGNKNRDALLLINTLSKENIDKGSPFNICTFKVFDRPASNMKIISHGTGSFIVNKKNENGDSIPDDIYTNIYKFYNKKIDTLSNDSIEYMNNHKVIIKKAKFSIVKDKRFTQKKYQVNISITINKNRIKDADGTKNINKNIILSVDRGERHLLAITVKDYANNAVLHQECLDTINNINYLDLIKNTDQCRKKQRKSWEKIQNIKNIKDTYCGDASAYLVNLFEKYHCLVAFENLDNNFIQTRSFIETNCYNKIIRKFLNKLECCIDKNNIFDVKQYINIDNSGLKPKNEDIVIFVNPSFTSKIDNKTGFINNFKDLKKIKTIPEKKSFFEKFDSIKYVNNHYEFSYDYKKFHCCFDNYDNSYFVITSEDERIVKRKINNYWESVNVDLTKELNEVMNNKNKNNIINVILNDNAVCNKFFDVFKMILQLRNSNKNIDYIYSPAIDSNGNHYDTRKFGCNYNADISASENIGLKCYLKIKLGKEKTIDYLNYLKNQ